MTAIGDRSPWSALGGGFPPTATHVGPFPHPPFLEAAEGAMDTEGEIIVTGGAAGAVAFVEGPDGIRFAGPETLTDYHSPLGDATAVMAEFFASRPGATFVLDSLPTDALGTVTDALDEVGATYTETTHAATGVLRLPESTDAWLSSIGKKERHEVRRKRRRYAEEQGPWVVRSADGGGLDRFVDLHRMAPGPKGSFMTDRMRSYFGSLLERAGASIHELVSDDRVVASAFGFETEDAYYYYNSAYDTDAAHSSPGIVLVSELIDRQIERGAAIFDFLKGAEAYKHRLGARPRPLTVLEGRLP